MADMNHLRLTTVEKSSALSLRRLTRGREAFPSGPVFFHARFGRPAPLHEGDERMDPRPSRGAAAGGFYLPTPSPRRSGASAAAGRGGSSAPPRSPPGSRAPGTPPPPSAAPAPRAPPGRRRRGR